MKLTAFERCILAEVLEIKDKVFGTSDYEPQIEALRDGYPGFYNLDYISEEVSDSDTNFVFEVLDMYQILQTTFLDANEELPENAKLAGFDGNHETQLVGFLRYMLRNGRWNHIIGAGDYPNSHSFQPDYRSQLRAFRDCVADRSPRTLSVDEARTIISAGFGK